MMKKILIDTNYYVAFKRNDPFTVSLFRRVEFLGINVVVLGELLAGFRCGDKEEQNLQELDLFLNSPRVSIVNIDEETAECYAKIFYDLREKGCPVPSNDMWIAASAMQEGLWLATYDGHFKHIEGLLTVPFRR
jgi:predicted nucleic acid-binding protein